MKLNDKYEESIKEIKSIYQKLVEVQETHNKNLTLIIEQNHNQMTRLIDNNETNKNSKSAREYNINGKIYHIDPPEKEGEFSVNYSDSSRNVDLGEQKTVLQDSPTINLGDVDVTELRNINTANGEYKEQRGNNNAMTNIKQTHSGSGDNVAGDKKTTYNYNNSQDLPQAAAEIQALLEQLEKTYPANSTTGKMAIATEAIKTIDKDTQLTNRILSALKAGGTSALDSLLDHPAASFAIAALEDWHQNKK